ncbi:MAG: polymerase, sigma 70 subunit, RpoD subfamily, partial [Verrucomicrobiales bacterium]|nr:polymerase, sigma 70 subunit, RpoD subfamily [Verrucomicrobiales bacterium]
MVSTISRPKSGATKRRRVHNGAAHKPGSKHPRAKALHGRKHHQSSTARTRHSEASHGRRAQPKNIEPMTSVSVRAPTTESPDNEPHSDANPRVLEHRETPIPMPTPAPRVAEPEVERQRYDANSALNLYLREIALTALLTIQEEVDLAKRIKRGDKKAREQMIKANLRLVVKIARDYENYGMPLLDLINEGNIGLMKAVERFDPAKGAKFSTYGAWWIKQSIKRALANQSKTIRLPVHVVDKVAHIRRSAMKLQEIFGREPTDEEIAEELGISRRRVTQYRAAAVTPTSLDASLGDEDSNRIADVIEDERAETPYQELEGKTNTALVRDMLTKLDDREATILKLRFNLNGDREETLEEIGKRFGVTR